MQPKCPTFPPYVSVDLAQTNYIALHGVMNSIMASPIPPADTFGSGQTKF